MAQTKIAFRIIKSVFLICLFAFLIDLNGQIITQPKNVIVCYKISGTTFIKTTSSKDKFQWEYKDITWKKLINDSNWSGTNDDTLVFLNQKGIALNYNVRCVVDSAGASVRTYISNEVLIRSFEQLKVPSIQKQQNICFNAKSDTLKINKYASGGDSIAKYQWQIKNLKTVNYSNIGKINDNFIFLGNLNISKTVRLYFETKSCGFGYSDTLNILVYDSMVKPKIGTHQTLCYNSTPSQLITLQTAKGGGDTFLYSWFYRLSNQTTFLKIDSSGKLQLQLGQQTKTCYVKLRAISQKSCGTLFSDSISIIVFNKLVKPKISLSQRICYNSTPKAIKIDSLASGGNDTFIYLWQNRSIGGSWQDISGASQYTFQPSALTASQYYRVKAVSTANCGTLFSDSIFIRVLNKIIKPKVSKNQTICYNTQPLSLNVDSTASGGNDTFTYNWQILSGSGIWQNISGANLKTYLPPSLMSNEAYRVIATSSAGCGNFPSDSVYINVFPKITRPKINSNQTICYGFAPNKLPLKNPASGGSGQFNYQWQSSTNKINWSNISNANGLELTPGNLIATIYYRILVDDINCGQFFSDTSTITVLPKLTKGILENLTPVCYGNSLNKPLKFTLTGKPKGGNDSFYNNIEKSNNGINWTNIGSLNGSGYLENYLKKSTFYRISSVSKIGCGSIISDSVFLTVYDSFTSPVIGNQQVVCEGDKLKDTLRIILPHSKAGTNFSYSWQKLNFGNIWTDIPGYSTTSFNMRLFNTSNFRLKVKSLNNCGEVFSNPINIEVNKGPDTFPITGNTFACKQSTDQLYQSKFLTGVSYSWNINNATVKKGQNTNQILLDWKNTVLQKDTILLTRINLNTGCANVIYLAMQFSNQNAPLKSEIKNIKGTRIMVCSDSSEQLNYLWGYINKTTRNEFIEKTSNLRYYEYINAIDTSQNIYFVKTSIGKCYTTNYYNGEAWSVNTDNFPDFNFKIYPNPSDNGFFRFYYPPELKITLSVLDMNGKILSNVITGNQISLKDYPPSTYVLKDWSGKLKDIYLIKLK